MTIKNKNYDVARLKLLALVEMRGSAVGLTPIGVRKLRNCQIVGKRRMSPEWPTLRLAVGGRRKGEIDALDLLRCRREARA